MVTSAVSNEGKSAISTFLSLTCSYAARDFCLLIDGDMRKPTIHKNFGMEKNKGLSNILHNHKSLPDAIRYTAFQNLYVGIIAQLWLVKNNDKT